MKGDISGEDMFLLADVDGDGSITPYEFKR